jgi:hypothetical protein
MCESKPPFDADGLQFVRVVPESSATRDNSGVICSACQQPIPDEYYEINGQVGITNHGTVQNHRSDSPTCCALR